MSEFLISCDDDPLAGHEAIGDDAGCDLISRLADEFAERCRRGESPSVSEFESRHPEYAGTIRELLSSVAMMEQFKRRTRASEPIWPMPERFGDFRVIRELGRGGMGIVFEAVQESLGRHVALKVIPQHVINDAKRLERFRREAHAIAQLHHTNIVPIFGVGEHEGLPYYAMQYIRGSSLDALVERWRDEGLPRHEDRWRFAARVAAQAAEALRYAHEQGVLHRDIKPANLLIDEHQTVWITDFGLAKLAGEDDLTASGDVIGTLRYLAPEALKGQTDERSDVYSLGLTLYEMLTLSPPYGTLSPGELVRHVTEVRPIRPRKLDPALPRDLETIVLKAIAFEPAHRYATAAALAEDLNRYLDDMPIRARRATAIERVWRWSRRNRTIAALTAIATGSLVLAAVVGWVGYASTNRALEGESKRRGEAEEATRRAEENVALSLASFEDLFEKLTVREPGPPPPRGRAGPRAGPDRGPTRPPPDAPGMGFAADDAALLRSVLAFYERFALRNATNPKLQGEAGRAYRKIGTLYQRLGRAQEAEESYARAAEKLERLTAEFPDNAGFRFELAKTYALAEADPRAADPAALESVERRLRHALTLFQRLVLESPDSYEYGTAQARAEIKLGTLLDRSHRSDEAEACYRRAIALLESTGPSSPTPYMSALERAAARKALAVLLLGLGRRDEAVALLDSLAGDLLTQAADERRPGFLGWMLADRLKELAEIFEDLGAAPRARELSTWAARLRAQPPRAGLAAAPAAP
jgi:tetratricopeptide (TPR) repeat protein